MLLALVAGVGLGYLYPGISNAINSLSIGTTNIPLAKVDFSLLPIALQDKKSVSVFLLLNWVIGPVLMLLLAVIFLKNEPDYMSDLILIGSAKCIAMVIVWNDCCSGYSFTTGICRCNRGFGRSSCNNTVS